MLIAKVCLFYCFRITFYRYISWKHLVSGVAVSAPTTACWVTWWGPAGKPALGSFPWEFLCPKSMKSSDMMSQRCTTSVYSCLVKLWGQTALHSRISQVYTSYWSIPCYLSVCKCLTYSKWPRVNGRICSCSKMFKHLIQAPNPGLHPIKTWFLAQSLLPLICEMTFDWKPAFWFWVCLKIISNLI